MGFEHAVAQEAGEAVGAGAGGVVGVADDVVGGVEGGFFEVFVEQTAAFGVAFPGDVLQGGAGLVLLQEGEVFIATEFAARLAFFGRGAAGRGGVWLGCGIDEAVVGPVPYAFHAAHGKRPHAGAAQRGQNEAAAPCGQHGPDEGLGLLGGEEGGAVFGIGVAAALGGKPKLAVAGFDGGGREELDIGRLPLEEFFGQGEVEAQAEQLEAVEQGADKQEAGEPEGDDIGEVYLIVEPDEPQQGNHGGQADAEPGGPQAQVAQARAVLVGAHDTAT